MKFVAMDHLRDTIHNFLHQKNSYSGACASASVLSAQNAGDDEVEADLVCASVEKSGAWEPPKAMAAFLKKHFNRLLKEDEREAINKDLPTFWIKKRCKSEA